MNDSNSASPGASRLSQIQKALETLLYLIGLLRRNAPIKSNLLILGSILSGFATPIIVWAMAGLVDVVNDGATEAWPKVFPWLLAFAIALLLRSVNVESLRYLASIIRERVDGAMQRDVAYKSIRMPLSAFESREYYDKLETGRRAIGGHLVDVLNSFQFPGVSLYRCRGACWCFMPRPIGPWPLFLSRRCLSAPSQVLGRPVDSSRSTTKIRHSDRK